MSPEIGAALATPATSNVDTAANVPRNPFFVFMMCFLTSPKRLFLHYMYCKIRARGQEMHMNQSPGAGRGAPAELDSAIL
jgi:hypothetical protein